MIQSYFDYKEYLRQDALANIKSEKCGRFVLWLNCWYGNDRYRTLHYLRALRKYEYVLNCTSGAIGKLKRVIAKVRWHRLGMKYNININPNVVGYGFRISHLVGGVIINCQSVGNHCTANAGVIVGNNDKGGMASIGNNVKLLVGCKVIGSVHIGDNAIVAPNSVVVKDVPENVIVSGIPATILKMRDGVIELKK